MGCFTPPPLCVLKDTTLTGYVINTNRLKPTTLNGDNAFDKGCLHNKINILRDVVMELKVDVLHITETHDSAAMLSTPTDNWRCHPSKRGIKSQGAATLTRLEVSKVSSDTNVSLVQVKWEKETLWVIMAYFPNELPDTIATVKAVDAMLQQ